VEIPSPNIPSALDFEGDVEFTKIHLKLNNRALQYFY